MYIYVLQRPTRAAKDVKYWHCDHIQRYCKEI